MAGCVQGSVVENNPVALRFGYETCVYQAQIRISPNRSKRALEHFADAKTVADEVRKDNIGAGMHE